MSKERLEGIKVILNDYEVSYTDDYASAINDATDDVNWLIERVQKLEEIKSDAIKQIDVTQRRNERLEKRARELERQNKALELEVNGWFNKANEIHESMLRQDKVIDKFRQQNKRYREALEEIMRTETVTSLTRGQVAYTFGGHIARKALKGESE